VNASPNFAATTSSNTGPTIATAAPTSPVAETPPPPQLTSTVVPVDIPSPKDSGIKTTSAKDDNSKDDGSKSSSNASALVRTTISSEGGVKEPAPTRKPTIVRNAPVTNGMVFQTTSRGITASINPMSRPFGLH
jgi:hypothetical protein